VVAVCGRAGGPAFGEKQSPRDFPLRAAMPLGQSDEQGRVAPAPDLVGKKASDIAGYRAG
jgi:hypothetical protein